MEHDKHHENNTTFNINPYKKITIVNTGGGCILHHHNVKVIKFTLQYIDEHVANEEVCKKFTTYRYRQQPKV